MRMTMRQRQIACLVLTTALLIGGSRHGMAQSAGALDLSQVTSVQTPPQEPASPSETTRTAEQSVTEAGGKANGRPAAAVLPHDLSPWGMFMAADWVVKSVMIGLAAASLVTWIILVAKCIEIACALFRAKRAIELIHASETLDEADRALANRGGPAAFMVRSAEEVVRKSAPALDIAGDGGVKERVVSRLVRIEARAGRRLTRGTGFLATIGATAPFVGLFGTVWGIMNAFIGISQAQTTNLAVVAPGIAEALLATALGLVAAIPAVVIYNAFARSITGYKQVLADAAAAVEQLVSHDLDFRKLSKLRLASAAE